MDKNVTLRLEAGGKKLCAGTGESEFRVFELEGLTGLEFDFTMSSGAQTPNASVLNRQPLPRKISLGIRLDAHNRDFLCGFFNPFEMGRLTIEWNGASRFIRYIPYPVTLEQSNVYSRISAFVSLLCPEPYWLDTDDYGKNIASRQNLIAFPFAFARGGIVPDYKLFSTEVAIMNRGDVSAPAMVVFTALGNVKNPHITMNGAEFMRVLADMKKGDTVEFSTDADNLYATMNGEDILNRTDPNMSFFQIPKGESVIKYGADDGTSNLNVFVYYRARYMGV